MSVYLLTETRVLVGVYINRWKYRRKWRL